MPLRPLFATLILLLSSALVAAQTTAFTYQGRLTTAGSPANGPYDLEFKIFDTPDVGTGIQRGPTVTRPAVQVTNGLFTLLLDFGAGAFDGGGRYLEIGMRPAGNTDPYTVLSPRQPVTSSPYAVRSLNAVAADGLSVACVNCVTSSQIQSLEGTQITGAIPVESVPTGSGNYIQNAAAPLRPGGKKAPQQAASFNVDGDGAIGGSLGIGTTAPETKLDVNGGPARVLPGNGGAIQFGTPNVETGMSIQHVIGSGRADVRFDGSTLKLVAVSGNFVPPNTNGIAIDTSGLVGIGTATPATKLDVNGGPARVLPGNGGAIQLGTPNVETGISIQHVLGANRADIRFDGSTLKLVTIAGAGVPGSTNGLAIGTSGNVGIGTTSPQFKLHIEAPGIVESNVRSTNDRAILALDGTVGGQRRVWTLESGIFGTPGLFGIYDRTASLARLTIDGTGLVGVKAIQIQGGGDFSENFDVTEPNSTEPGALSKEVERGLVVSIDPENPGKLVVSRRAYDRSVAGIISGAGGISPGLVMGQQGTIADGKQPVALTGRVWAYCDASRNAIKPGDLLTTSPTPGHAMKVIDYRKAQGAIIGKAMTGLKAGRGLVLVLVSLQ